MATKKPNPAQTTNTKLTMAEILDKKKPLETECQVLILPEYQDRLRALQEELIATKRESKTRDISQPGSTKIEKEIEKLYEEAGEYYVTFRFRDIGRKRLDALAREHPPTKDQQEEYKKLNAPGVLEFNVDTFGPELVAATNIEPGITLDEATQVFDNWGAGEIDLLFSTALTACRGRAQLPLFRKGIGVT